jgi:hypothetical protein
MSSHLDDQVQKLCREIPEEKDSEKMMKLVNQLNQLLEARESAATHPHLTSGNPQPSEIPNTAADPQQRKSA